MARSESVRASTSSLTRAPVSPSYSGALEAAPPSSPAVGRTGVSDSAIGLQSGRSSIQVAVRVRPLCDKERQRGDRVAWEADRDGNVGVVDPASGAFVPRHRFDTVFGPESDNRTVAEKVALPLVAPALVGVNGTIFAYGVTSSGKTHTMMGTDTDPGVVPRVVRELFAQIAAGRTSGSVLTPRVYSVRMSIMEIYNEVLNDLLDPSRTNLKVREDSRSGLVLVEGLLEQAVSSAEQALELIARGDHNRKVSATAFNEDSSRSHTITRIIVESAASTPSSGNDPAASAGERPVGRRTTACISLIDLAGSESARAVISKSQRREGSYINRSLLTLGTVIHKLAAGAAGHVPFRDSKLTRLLQPSLSGPGARVSVVCNITPAAAQTDETANTLKFASRAKLIQVTARSNEILDERALLRRYQKEVADLKRQLGDARRLLSAAGMSGSEGFTGLAATGSLSVVGPGGGFRASSGGEATAAELQAERDARRTAEVESTMLRIKLTRLQAYLEEIGVNVDDLLLAGTAAGSCSSVELAGDAVFRSSSRLRSSLTQMDDVSVLAGAGVATQRDKVAEERRRRPAALEIPPPGSQEPGPEGEYGAQQRGPDGGAEAGLGQKRESLSNSILGGPELAEASAKGRGAGWHEWSDRRAGATGASSLSGSERAGVVVSEASADLRARVAEALGATAGGGCGGGGGSVSGTASGSDLEVEDDLNEGIMAQIRDMISEARLASPTPPSVASQPVRTQGDDCSTAEASTSGGLVPSRRPPSGDAAVAGTSTAGAAADRATSILGGPSSISSHHRRSATLSTASSSFGAGQELDMELELQVLNADREVLHDQLVASEAANERLTAQIADLRRSLAMYEQLTRHASTELAEIRRLKDAFQGRLQRENDMLRAQLTQLGVTPAVSMDPRPQPRGQPAPGADTADPNLVASMGGTRATLQAPPQLQAPSQPENHGVQNMEAFGSPAAVAPIAMLRPTAVQSAGT